MPSDPLLLSLHDARARDPARTGRKAAALAALLQAGLPVPDGWVITVQALAGSAAGAGAAVAPPGRTLGALRWIAEQQGDVPLAVRSSALAEDLDGASFAGMYETVLGVRGFAALADAVARCWQSPASTPVNSYLAHRGIREPAGIAVLIQRFVRPSAAGVALGASPLTGDRSLALVSAVHGNGAALVSGERDAEEWEVTARTARCRSPGQGVLTADSARLVAATLRRVEKVRESPQDVEWALADGQVFVLQARPLTALPPEARWSAPLRGGWFRDIRLGEWLPEPVTPLFESWLLERMELRFARRQAAEAGLRTPLPLHVTVNGWYFHSPLGTGGATRLLRALARKPALAVATLLGTTRPNAADRLYFGEKADRWAADVLYPYQQRVARCRDRAGLEDPAGLVQTVNELADAAGDFLWSLVLLGGAAWRCEVALARFHRRFLRTRLTVPYQALLGGLNAPATHPHAVQSLDWIRPTLGELAPTTGTSATTAKRQQPAAAARGAAEAACRQVLTSHRRRARFESLLAVAQRLASVREAQGASFTLAWPVLRQCAVRLGEAICAAGVLGEPGDAFFVTRAELMACLSGNAPPGIAATAVARRAEWEGQRRLSPPLAIGHPPWLLSRLLLSTPKFMRPLADATDGNLRGVPASPGRATGPVRVLRDPADMQSVRPGEVLVVPAVVPALTPLFDRIVAVCADTGSVAAHAALIAREYGLPAVTGVRDATTRLADGVLATVDGTTGVIEIR